LCTLFPSLFNHLAPFLFVFLHRPPCTHAPIFLHSQVATPSSVVFLYAHSLRFRSPTTLHARSCCPPLLDSPTIIKGILLPLCTHSPFSFTDHFVRTLLSSFTSRRPHHHKGNSSSFTHTHSPFSSSDHLARTPLLSSTSRRPHRHSGS
jgi:hypothetical protein